MKIRVCEGTKRKWSVVGDKEYAAIPRIGDQVVANRSVYVVSDVKLFQLDKIEKNDSVAAILCQKISGRDDDA